MDSGNLSSTTIDDLRNEASATLRYHGAVMQSVAAALADFDEAIVLSRDERSVDELAALEIAAQRLAERLAVGV